MPGWVKKRGPNSWAVVVYMGRDPETHRERRKWYSGFKTQKEAQAYQTMLAQHPGFGAGVGPYGSARERLSDYFKVWLRDYARSNVSPGTFETYSHDIRRHITPVLGHVPLSRLSPGAVQKFYSTKLDQGLSPTYVSLLGKVLHESLKHAVEWGRIVKNPCDLARPPKRHKYRAVVWTPDQTAQFLRESQGRTLHWLMYAVKATTGVRAGELLGLSWDDTDLAVHVFNIRQAVSRPKGGGYQLKEPKTHRGVRKVPFPAYFEPMLRSLWVKQKEERIARGLCKREDCRRQWCKSWHHTGLIFTQPNGKPLHWRNLRRLDWYPLVHSLGLPKIRPHDLRHGSVTLLLESAVNPKLVADVHGHSTPGFTLEHYGHALPVSQHRTAEVAGQLLPGATGLLPKAGPLRTPSGNRKRG